jgi:hypothetical protein
VPELDLLVGEWDIEIPLPDGTVRDFDMNFRRRG